MDHCWHHEQSLEPNRKVLNGDLPCDEGFGHKFGNGVNLVRNPAKSESSEKLKQLENGCCFRRARNKGGEHAQNVEDEEWSYILVGQVLDFCYPIFLFVWVVWVQNVLLLLKTYEGEFLQLKLLLTPFNCALFHVLDTFRCEKGKYNVEHLDAVDGKVKVLQEVVAPIKA